MSCGPGGPVVAVHLLANPPDPRSLPTDQASEAFTAGPLWTNLAARHFRHGRACWLQAEIAGRVVGTLPFLRRRHRGIDRLESSFDGTVAGPRLVEDLADETALQVVRALLAGLVGQLGGRTMVAAVTLDSPRMSRLADSGPDSPWTVTAYESAVVDCRQGLAQVEAELWTNNRRNERNRGLKRGCTLHAEHDPEVVAAWYPLYLAGTARWQQAPVPLGFLQDLLRRAPDQTVFNCVRLDGALVAGHFCFVSRNRLVAWQGAARPELARTHFLTTLLYWQDVVHACGQGLAAVDFGGCVGRDGLWDFKRRCGAEPEPRWQLLARSGPGRWLQRLTAAARARRGGAA